MSQPLEVRAGEEVRLRFAGRRFDLEATVTSPRHVRCGLRVLVDTAAPVGRREKLDVLFPTHARASDARTLRLLVDGSIVEAFFGGASGAGAGGGAGAGAGGGAGGGGDPAVTFFYYPKSPTATGLAAFAFGRNENDTCTFSRLEAWPMRPMGFDASRCAAGKSGCS